MPKSLKKLIIFASLAIAILALANFAMAANGPDVGLEQAAGTGLAASDPRIIAANIIRIVLGFLGILAVGLIIYAGWLWMTAEGAEEKVEQAKKILTGAVIGLAICLASFAIASFVLNSLLNAVNGTGGGGGGYNANLNPGGAGSGGGNYLPTEGQRCLTDAQDSQCAAGLCASGLSCSGASCTCEKDTRPGEGQSCDADKQLAGCQATECSSDLICSSQNNCTCIRTPLISWISPLDSAGAPNGAAGNFITIGGRYFGQAAGQVIFLGDPNNPNDDKVASFPNQVNPQCVGFWQDNQIIAVVPAGAVSGPIKVADSAGLYDTTDNDRGARLKDFAINNIKRPGVCQVSPGNGGLADPFNVQGSAFGASSRSVFFGVASSSLAADNIAGWSNTSVNAAVPNIRDGRNSIFVQADSVNSNDVVFTVANNSATNPVIEYIEPNKGPAGQYITVYGRNFKTYNAQKSSVKFYLPADPNSLINADINFPENCRANWWHDTYIVIKVPKVNNLGAYKVKVTNSDSKTSAAADFTINNETASPGLCALDPNNGPVGQAVSSYGEKFGSTQGSGRIQYYNNKDGAVSGWADGKIDSSVPAGSVTGPVKAISGQEKISNSLPFRVGKCSTNNECEFGEECCGSGTSWKGICRPTGSCSGGASYNCAFGWNFTTGNSSATGSCASGQTTCGSSCCSSGQTCDPFGNGGNGRCDSIACQYATCGDSCCLGASSCVNGSCPANCSADQTACGSSCCSSGQTCDPFGNGGNGRCDSITCQYATCGDTCCFGATSCVNGSCPPGTGALIVSDYLPKGDSACRNSLVRITFNQQIDAKTLANNMFLVGDYGAGQCPADTKYLTFYKPTILDNIKRWLSGTPVLNKLFTPEALALEGNFCAVPGSVKALTTYDKKTEVEFRPAKILDAGRKYYVILKGDPNLSDNLSQGILSLSGATLALPLDEQSFNSVLFQGKIWSFTTKSQTAADDGVCQVKAVAINPSGYLFKTSVNDPSDDDLSGANYDKVKDSDKVFTATAYSAEAQPITPIEGIYNWRWDWSIENQDVVKFSNGQSGGLDNSQTQTLIAQNVKEANTLVHAKAVITQDKVSKLSTVGAARESASAVYVFLCANPWPPFKDDGSWEPWRDASGNCTVQGSNCSNTNFELYYCRDAGAAGTADDLPAILSDKAVIRDASPDQNILKEFYFFREGQPNVSGANLTAVINDAVKQGGKAGLRWQAIAIPSDQVLEKYIVYYGTKSKSYSQSVSAAAAGTSAAPFIVNNLTNKVTYYFAVTARYKSGSESEYSNEVAFTPADTWAPFTPSGLIGTAGTGSATVSWTDNQDGTAVYKAYYGATSGSLGASVSVDKKKCAAGKCQAIISGLNGGTSYYFAVSAIDAYGNESQKSGEINLTIL